MKDKDKKNYFDLFYQLSTNIQIKQFIDDHLSADSNHILLKHKQIDGVPVAYVVRQIQGKNIAKVKFPSLVSEPDIIYPSKICLEQASSEKAASFKAALYSGTMVLDITGGFGMDACYFSNAFNKVIYVEKDPELAAIAKWNFNVLNKNNIEVVCDTAENYLKKIKEVPGLIYADPSRRKAGKKVFLFEDCSPGIFDILQLKPAASAVLIKSSPLIDITAAGKTIEKLERVRVLAIKNECKEILFEAGQQEKLLKVIPLDTYNYAVNNIQKFTTSLYEDEYEACVSEYPHTFLYEPNAAIMKTGKFQKLCHVFQVGKLHNNTHLFTSKIYISDFPGRKFKIHKICGINDVDTIKQYTVDGKINIINRNHPMRNEEIKKRMKLDEGGCQFLIACKLKGNKNRFLIAEKI